MGYDVFLSYSSKDRPFATALCHNLETFGIKCWIDYRDLHAGYSWRNGIVEALTGNPDIVMVLIFSSASNDSHQVVKELGLADNYRLTVIPVRIENIKPTGDLEYELSGKHWMDAFEDLQHVEIFSERIKQSVLEHKKKKTNIRMGMEESTIPTVIPVTISRTDNAAKNLNQSEQKYFNAIQVAYEDSQITEIERAKLEGMLEVLEISPERAQEIENQVMMKLGLIKSLSESEKKYLTKLKEVFSDGHISEVERAKLEGMLEVLDISPDRSKELEEQVKKELAIIAHPITEQITLSEGILDFKGVLCKMADDLNMKYQSSLQKLKTDFQFKGETWGYFIYSDIYIGPLSFCLFGGFYGNKYAVEFWDTTGVAGSKYVTGDWVNKYIKSDFPDMAINNRKTYGYISLWSKEKESGVLATSEEDIIKEFKTKFTATCDVLLPKLSAFHAQKIETISKLVILTDKIVEKLENEFPSKSGWIIENTAIKLGQEGRINVSKNKWAQKVTLCIEAGEVNLANLYFGLRRGQYNLKYKDDSEEKIKTKFDTIFSSNKESEEWWLAWEEMEEPHKFAVKNNFLEDNFIYLLDTKEKEAAFINSVVEKFVKMKELIQLIDEVTTD